MRYHDFHLQGYVVKDEGKTIALNLVYDYEGTEKELSCITFSDVTLYDFNHTTGAIITGIEEFDILSLVKDKWQDLQHWSKWYGISHWHDDQEQFSKNLKSNKYKVWEITSAIGFYGFVIAKKVENT
jgi:hypothetical protein